MNNRTERALIELKKFFIVAQSMKGEVVPMPVSYVDECWHELQRDTEDYKQFTHSAVGADVAHGQLSGRGVVPWTETYEKLFGALDTVWFVDPSGNFDEESYSAYEATGTWEMAWDCNPLIQS